MRSIVFLLISLALLYPTKSFTQLNKDYQPLKLKGPIPPDLQTSVKRLTLAELAAEGNSLDEKSGRQYYAMSNFAFKQAMQSGQVYFNDPFSTYLNQIADKLLQNEPGLRKQIRIYATRLSVPNASAWRNGVIFFNMSLFSYMESEAQIAFVLAHEITHYVEKHNLRRFKKKIDIQTSYRKKSKEADEYFELLRFSQENELEADIEAFKLIRSSEYSEIEALGALMQLKEINENPVVFSQTIPELFQIQDTSFKYRLVCDSLKYSLPIKYNKEEEDSISTHPDIQKRIKIISEELENSSDTPEGAFFLIKDEKSFELLKDMAYIEQIQNLYDKGAYVPTLYAALRMASYYPDNQYLQEIAGKSLYWICRYLLYDQKDEVIPETKYLSGSYGLFVCYFRSKNKGKIFDLGSLFLEERAALFPESEILLMYKAKMYLLDDMQGKAKRTFEDFLEKFPESENAAFAQIHLDQIK